MLEIKENYKHVKHQRKRQEASTPQTTTTTTNNVDKSTKKQKPRRPIKLRSQGYPCDGQNRKKTKNLSVQGYPSKS